MARCHTPLSPRRPRVRSRPVVSGLAMLLSVLAAPGAPSAGTYYVDNSSPSCSDLGPGTAAQPYCTISAALELRGGPGTTLFVMPGVYREEVTLEDSGASGSPLVIQALGSPVIVDGADDFGSSAQWVHDSGNVYLAAGVTWRPKQVFVDGQRLTPSTASPTALPVSTFQYVDSVGLYLNAGGDDPGLHATWVGRRTNGFKSSGRSWVTIDGFTVTRTEDRAIELSSGSHDIVIRNNTVSYAYRYGIALADCQSVLVEKNAVSDNQDHGIALTQYTQSCTIQDNECARNVHPTTRQANGIYLNRAQYNLLQRNRLHHNQDTGEHLASTSDNNTSIQNLSWSNGDHGYDRLNSVNTLSIGDVAYGNYKDGFSNEGASPGGQMYNCIAIENGLTTGEYDLWVDSQSSVGFVSNYNIFWNSTGQAPIKFVSTVHATMAAYQAASGQDAQSVQEDPRFVNAGGGDFHLREGSPAIDAATSSVTGWPATDAEGHERVDDPASPNGGTGTVTFADRGALERIVDQAPVVAAPATATGPVGSLLAVSVTAWDPDLEGIVSLTATGLPAGATFTAGLGNASGTLTWTPSAGDTGSHPVTFTASNALSGSATTVITVGPPNQPPVAALVVTPSAGSAPLTVTASAAGSSDPEGSTVAYTFDFGDGTLEGPQAASSASHTYAEGNWTATVTVTDSEGATDSAAVSLLVTSVTTGVPGPDSGDAPLRARLSPSPLRAQGSLSFFTTRPGPLQVELLDASGRRVRRLANETGAPAGLHQFELDGRDHDHRLLSSGVYFYVIRAAEGVASGRFAIVR